ncbi:hypothetical protein PN36_24925 [Candidatus Thiomargarita nelsonii]|uniref:Uncharacterized protein n=1 Tax=Candidatus Thiomargarita nelsonii TaxID=1003181 RepID=A0A0A6P7U2_9GAMM|nr:hypothetical protein PN36_24925 [Candidatus Thiomargarita nelsonii]
MASTIGTEQLKLEAVNHLGLVCDKLKQSPDIFINKGLLVLFGGSRQALIKQIPALLKSDEISFIVRLRFRELALQSKS